MSVEHLIALFGYPVILVGAFLEGEMTLVLAGFGVHRGYLSLPWVIVAAFCGALWGDQFFFQLGRHESRAYLEKHPTWRARIQTVQGHIDRFRTLFVLGFRFVWGIRSASPFVLGMGDISTGRFVVLDAASVLVWATVWISLGYLFGNAMGVVIEDMQHYELDLAGVIIAIGAAVWAVRLCRKRRYTASVKKRG